ncbi:GNAT family N-acetyltransferase [Rothia nasisuis]|uniref:GNAT family N-acetyltransferase n=1 Tax=Rothia nasisuis TaxID=2109647 RepID=UPI001F02F0A1|nr:GNAT family N-acetyltransferase [Rothia nasisuis]
MTVLARLSRGADDALIRPLTLDNRAELETMIASDPVGFLFAAEHLAHFGLPAPSALTSLKTPHGFVGVFVPSKMLGEMGPKDVTPGRGAPPPLSAGEGLPGRARTTATGLLTKATTRLGARARRTEPVDRAATPMPGLTETLTPMRAQSERCYALVGAFWLGANCVPLTVPATYHRQVATYIWRHNRRIGSIFGHRAPVLGIWEHLARRMPAPFDVRDTQLLLELPSKANLAELAARSLARPEVAVPPILEPVRWARSDDRPSLLRASVAMFTEEVGYDPMTRDPAGYSRRIDELTRTGRTLVAVNSENVVIFKTDVGLAHGSICQLQGVWLHPAYRGQGLAPVLLAQACQLIRPRFPHLSLYVNDFNAPARALYQATGWQQRATYATVLF